MEFLNSLNGWAVFFVVFVAIAGLDVVLCLKREPTPRAAIFQTLGYISLGLLFGFYVYLTKGADAGAKWWTGFTLEYALSVDNLFVIGVIMTAFSIAPRVQRTLLYCGIAGAMLFRALFIGAGTAIVSRYWWLLFLMGLFLVFAGYKILFMQGDDDGEAEPALVQRVKKWGIGAALGALITVELTDILFAMDSVPAVLAVSTDTFIAFTAPMFAVLGLRSLYFAVQALKDAFHHLPKAIGIVLMFIGVKIVLPSLHLIYSGIPELHVPTVLSLVITVVILAGGIIASKLFPEKVEAEVLAEAN